MSTKHFLFVLLIGFTELVFGQEVALIPYPNNIEVLSDKFTFPENISITYYSNTFEKEAQFLTAALLNIGILKTRINISNQSFKPQNTIELIKDEEIREPEAYSLVVSPSKIQIKANTATGIFYGIQSLLQLVLTSVDNKSINCVNIYNDSPQYKWRGMHLDCSRHFFEPEFIKKYIDILASYKFNYFHWHLTDDQGWRIEIKKYPKLTQIGAYRAGTMKGHYTQQQFDSIPYGGFYTQETIKELVAYAKIRHIEIVPEIDMPGHARAAIAAYPELSCDGNAVAVGMKWGIEKEVLCPTPFTFQFIDDVMFELSNLFPGKYIHIGGDEVIKESWENSAFCKQLMRREKLQDATELQAYFMNQIEKITHKYRKKAIGWDEITEKNTQTHATIMSWRGMEAGIEAAKQQREVIMTPIDFCYFDHYQGKEKNEPLAIGGYTPLEQVYGFNPCPDSIPEPSRAYILGAQGNVWTEYMASTEQVEYMAVPRLCALSEVVWSAPKNKQNFDHFKTRLIQQQPYLNKKQIHFSKTFLSDEATKK